MSSSKTKAAGVVSAGAPRAIGRAEGGTRALLISRLLLGIAIMASAADAAPTTDEARIRSLETRFAVAVAAKDIDGVMSVYAPTVQVFDVSPPPQYEGLAAYRENWQSVFAGFAGPIRFQITNLVITTEGSMAFSHSIQHLSGADAKGVALNLTVRVTDVYRKQGGAWRIVHEHVSVPVDLATAKPDFGSKP